ncbi:MAG: hypothetical protein ACXAE3_07845 [Candidatus Kariarchaeaceae archaeon]|jgi:hypothetical protein
MELRSALTVQTMMVSSLIISVILFLTAQLDSLQYEPSVAASEWCSLQPCLEVAGLTLSQPTSSVLVFALGIITIFLGVRLEHKLWSYALVFWGLGAISAGISYQLLGYELKCTTAICSWTTPWELAYMVFTMASISTMLWAVTGRQILAQLIFYLYSLNLIIAAMIPIRFLISFEFLLVVAIPQFLVMFAINVRQREDPVSLSLLTSWVLLGLIMVIYFAYFFSGLTHILWERGIWFSENDVLHILLILWMRRLYYSLVH